VRTAQTEHPGRFVLVDTDSTAGTAGTDSTAGVPDLLARALATGEDQLAVRGNELLAPRLTRVTATGGADSAGGRTGLRLDYAAAGTIENLHLTDCRRRPRHCAPARCASRCGPPG